MDSADTNDQASAASKAKNWFATTHWSVVLTAGRNTTQSSQAALDTLCRTYWYPLYAYVRRAGNSPEDAQDLTQGFFVRLLEKQYIAKADKDRGRFRSFLLASLKYFLINERAKAQAVRRGGHQFHFSIDAAAAEDRYTAEPATYLTPDKIFQKRWATTVIEQALETLRQEYAKAGNRRLFERLKEQLLGDSSTPYAQIGKEFGMKEGSIKTAVFRLRKRFAESLRAAIANTVTTPDEIEEELNALISAFRR